MKWPERLTLIRHDVSAYNALKPAKQAHPLYQAFQAEFDKDPDSDAAHRLAIEVQAAFSLTVGDHNTPLAPGEGHQSKTMAEALKARIPVPDIIFVSPYDRTHETLKKMKEGWPALEDVKIVEEERIREQDHGLALLYSDWRVFEVLHPDQRRLRAIQSGYWYRYPNGENVPDVRARLRSWLTTLTRDFSEKGVMAVTHHLAILSLRANLERLGADAFNKLDQDSKPINAGVTRYRGDPDQGSDGRLILDAYNVKLY